MALSRSNLADSRLADRPRDFARIEALQEAGRWDEAGAELVELVKDEKLAGVPTLILANKQDLFTAMSVEAIIKKLKLRR